MTVLDRAARRERWVPAPRPDWLAKVNAEGACFNDTRVEVQLARPAQGARAGS